MRFIRKNGRVIPIRDGGAHAVARKKESESTSKEKPVSAGRAAVAGTAIGAGYHVAREHHFSKIEKLAPNVRAGRRFTAKLRPGDILVMGQAPKHSDGITVEDVLEGAPANVKRVAKRVGLKEGTQIVSNSTLLTAYGAGKKYHAAIYMGKGRAAHMTTDVGIVTDRMSDLLGKHNVTAFRFANSTKREADSAVKFAKRALKKKVQYQEPEDFVKNAVSNLVVPLSKPPQKKLTKMVCHTLPIRAYAHRNWGFLGEHTYSGDFKKVAGLKAIARHDVIKSPRLIAGAYAGIASRGLKWGAAAGLAAVTANFVLKKRKKESN